MQVTTLIDIPFANEPVSLSMAAGFCKVAVPIEQTVTTGTVTTTTLTAEGETLKLILLAAREWCEKYTELSFGPKTLQVELNYADYENRGTLPYGPNIQITEVKDQDGKVITTELFKSADYYNEYLKGIRYNNRDSYNDFDNPYLAAYYTIKYTAGYAVGLLPSTLKQAILKTCLELYNNRENTVIGTIIAELPLDAKVLLNPYRSKVLF